MTCKKCSHQFCWICLGPVRHCLCIACILLRVEIARNLDSNLRVCAAVCAVYVCVSVYMCMSAELTASVQYKGLYVLGAAAAGSVCPCPKPPPAAAAAAAAKGPVVAPAAATPKQP